MESWLQHPAFQSAAAPLALSFVLAFGLAPLRLSGLAVTAGVLACVHLALGLDLVPLNATRRIVVLVVAGALLGATLDRLPRRARGPGWPLPLGAALAAVWVVHVALSHRETGAALALGAGLALFAGVVVWGFDRLAARPLRAASAAFGAGVGAGGSALLGASASLGQIGLALAAAAGGYLLAQWVRGGALPAGRALTLPAGLVSALVALAAVVLARLPWTALPFVAAVPFAATIPVGDRLPAWLQVVVHGAIAATVGGGAIAVAWTAAGAPSSGY